MAQRRKLPGFDTPPAKYPKPFPASYLETHKFVRPQSGDLNHDPVIQFKVPVASDETIKFSPEPFTCLYSVYLWDETNSDWKLSSVPPFDRNKNPYFLDLNRGAAAFFSEIEIILDNKPFKCGNIGALHPFLESFNKAMLNHETFKKKYGRVNPRIRYTADQTVLEEDNQVATDATDKDKKEIFSKNIQAAVWNRNNLRLKSAVEPLTMDSEQATTFKQSQFGFFTFPFEAQLNASAVWTGSKYSHGFLPLGKPIAIRLMRQSPLTIALERFDCNDDNRVDSDHTLTEVKIKIEIKDLLLNYTSLILRRPEQIDRINKADMIFYQDKISTQIKNLNPDIKLEIFNVNLPGDCIGVVLLFFHQSMMFPNRDKYQTMSCKRRFPENIQSMGFEIAGRPGLLSAQGLNDLTTSNKSQSVSLRTYYSKLVRSGLYDEPFHCLAPTHRMSAHSYDDTVFLDLYQYELKDPQDLTVTLHYTDKNSKKGWHCATFAVTQTQIGFKNGLWTWDETHS